MKNIVLVPSGTVGGILVPDVQFLHKCFPPSAVHQNSAAGWVFTQFASFRMDCFVDLVCVQGLFKKIHSLLCHTEACVIGRGWFFMFFELFPAFGV